MLYCSEQKYSARRKMFRVLGSRARGSGATIYTNATIYSNLTTGSGVLY